VLSAFSNGTGKKLRRSHRHLEETFGPIRVECAETLEQAESIFEEMVVLHQERWQSAGEPGTFASKRFTEFHRDLIRKLFPRGQVLLVRVTAGDVTVGCDYNLIEHGRAMAYQWGLGQFEDTLISPGVVTSVAVMQTAMERGLDEYDWLSGDVFYKRQLSTGTREMVWARLPRGVRGHLVDYALRARRYSKQRTKSKTESGESEDGKA
jgi:CelD/BcsL family acetyltransferase involved in cellulose biosynthesis